MACAALRKALARFNRPGRAGSAVRISAVAAMAWAVASDASADRFSYRDDRECADTPNAEMAIAACTRLYESAALGPSNRAIALGNRGAALKSAGRYDQAMADFTIAMALDPRNPQYFCQRGDVLRKKRAFKDAIADYTAALTRAPGSLCAYQGRAQAHLAAGNTHQALADVAKGLSAKPASLQLLFLRGRANSQAKLYDAAVTDFSRALASRALSGLQSKDRATIYSQRALASLMLNRPDNARADVNEALRLAPDNASAIAAKGTIDEQLGRKTEAVASYSRALAINPDLEDAKRGLERLAPPQVTARTFPASLEPAALEDAKRSPEGPALPDVSPPRTLAEAPRSKLGAFAATLYKITRLASGEHRTDTSEFSNLAQCLAAIKLFRSRASLMDKTSLYCIKHAMPPLSER